MCLGIPALVKERTGDIGKVDFGGTGREVNLSLVDAKVGDYVIVHAGFAIQVLDQKEAEENLELLRQIGDIAEAKQEEVRSRRKSGKSD